MSIRILIAGVASLFLSGVLQGQSLSVIRYYDDRHGQSMTWALSGTNATTPGAVRSPYPTIHNLAVEWGIEGDDNLNGVVTVRYRVAGTSAWKDAMPLRRVPGMVYDSGDLGAYETGQSMPIYGPRPETQKEPVVQGR